MRLETFCLLTSSFKGQTCLTWLLTSMGCEKATGLRRAPGRTPRPASRSGSCTKATTKIRPRRSYLFPVSQCDTAFLKIVTAANLYEQSLEDINLCKACHIILFKHVPGRSEAVWVGLTRPAPSDSANNGKLAAEISTQACMKHPVMFSQHYDIYAALLCKLQTQLAFAMTFQGHTFE